METIRVVTRAGDPSKFKTDYFNNIRHAVNYARQFDGKLYVGTQQLEVNKMTHRFKYVENNEFGLDVYYDRLEEQHFVEIPHTHTGWGSGTLERANNLALGQDADRCGQMNIVDMYDVSGTGLVAIVDNYTSEQWELLEELVTELEDYPIYDDILFTDIEGESQIEAIDRMLPYDAEVEPELVLESIHMLDLYFVEEEGENWYISEDDFKVALQHATYYRA